MNTAVQSISFQPRLAAHRQISDSLREKIKLGEILPGTRLPSTQVLAKTWGSHVATVHMSLAMLAAEGLLERTKKGTFVRKIGNRLSTVGVYFGSNIWDMDSKDREYIRHVYRHFQDILRENRIVEQVLMDQRPPEEQRSKWTVLEKAVDEHAIQGLVILTMDMKHAGWLPRMNIPTTGLTSGIFCNVVNDMDQFIEAGVQSLIKKGCRSIGLIAPYKKDATEFYGYFNKIKDTVEKNGVEIRREWVPIPSEAITDQELYGYEQFRSIWSRQVRPDGILVYTDLMAKGVITAVLQEKVRIPDELRLALHRNREMEYLCPFPVTFIESNCRAAAEKLWEQLQAQLRGEAPNKVKLKFSVVEEKEDDGNKKVISDQ